MQNMILNQYTLYYYKSLLLLTQCSSSFFIYLLYYVLLSNYLQSGSFICPNLVTIEGTEYSNTVHIPYQV